MGADASAEQDGTRVDLYIPCKVSPGLLHCAVPLDVPLSIKSSKKKKRKKKFAYIYIIYI